MNATARHNPSLTLAVDPSGNTVTIHEVSRGLECNCICLECKESLIARKGDVVSHHFAHLPDSTCNASNESVLHKAAKRLIQEKLRIYFGSWPFERFLHSEILGRKRFFREHPFRVGGSGWAHFERVEEEKDFRTPTGELVRPDLVAYTNQDEKPYCFIEMVVTHRMDDEKKKRLKRIGIPTVEIDLSPLRDLDVLTNSNKEKLFELINFKSHRTWPVVLREVQAFWSQSKIDAQKKMIEMEKAEVERRSLVASQQMFMEPVSEDNTLSSEGGRRKMGMR